MVEADDQDVLSKYIEIYGPNINMMVDYSRVLKWRMLGLATVQASRFGGKL